MQYLIKIISFFLFLLLSSGLQAEDGYRLWLRYNSITDHGILKQYNKRINAWKVEGDFPMLTASARELQVGLNGLLGRIVPETEKIEKHGTLVAGTPENSEIIASLDLDKDLKALGDEGYLIINAKCKGKRIIVIAANSDKGVLYGTFHFLRLLQTQSDIRRLNISITPVTAACCIFRHIRKNHFRNMSKNLNMIWTTIKDTDILIFLELDKCLK